MGRDYKRLVIKIGSNVLAGKDGLPDEERMRSLTEEISALRKEGREIVLVSSGAVAAGRSLVKVSEKSDEVEARQLLASVGQVLLIRRYADLFKARDLLCSQVLVTKEDFRDKLHYKNMHSCFEILLRHHIIPVVNENDVISVTELMFTDNDELAGLIASMIKADALIILTNVDGLYNGDPKAPGSVLLEQVQPSTSDFSGYISTRKSDFGRGGMLTKSNMARKIARLGIPVHLANGTKDHILQGVFDGTAAHTCFLPYKGASATRRWIAHTDNYAKGSVQVNEGACTALLGSKASSLLPVGITSVSGEFLKNDVIRIVDPRGRKIGLGMARYDSDTAREYMGKNHQPPLVHYDYLYLNQE
jgi:glutamate 5-kinase